MKQHNHITPSTSNAMSLTLAACSHFDLTLGDHDEMAATLQMTFSNSFSFLKILYFDWNFAEICSQESYWYVRLGSEQATCHYLNQWWSSLLRHTCIPQAWWVNSLWPNDAICRHRSGSTLAQVMACCLTAPTHYLNKCWLIISKTQLHSSDGKFTRDTSVIND